MIERWLLALATVLAAFAAFNAVRSLTHGERSRCTLPLLIATFIAQFMALGLRGEMRGACPLFDTGEVLAFLSWSLVLFYLLFGPAYRLSLLGLFTAPLAVLLQVVALIPGVMTYDPEHVGVPDPWREAHAALSVLSFGALALAAVSGSMFLLLDRLLRQKKLTGGLFANLPSIHDLVDSTRRLLLVGLGILTVGIAVGFLTPDVELNLHFIVALVVWIAYAVLVAMAYIRGIPPQKFSILAVVFFVVSLVAFGVI